jgi:predicted lipid-binding transport protein (Tim44 family)
LGEGKSSQARVVEDDVSTKVHGEAAQGSPYRTGKTQLAGTVQKQQNAFPGAVAFPGIPEAGPLADGQQLPVPNPTNSLFNPKGDLDRAQAARVNLSTPFNRHHRSIKYVT